MSKKRKSFADKIARNAETQNKGRAYGYLNIPKGIDVFKVPKEGRVDFDVLPYTVTDKRHADRNDDFEIAQVGDLWYKKPFKTHKNIGTGQNKTSVVCLSVFGKSCPLCEYRDKLIEEKAPKKDIDALNTSLRNLYVVRPLDTVKYEDKLHVWDYSQYLFQSLLNEEIEEKPKYGNFPSLEDGYTISVRFEERSVGKSKHTFGQANRIDFEERDYEYPESILDEVPNLDEMLVELSVEEINALFFGLDEADLEGGIDDEDYEKVEKTTRRKKKTSSKDDDEPSPLARKRKTVEPEDEDVEPSTFTRSKTTSKKSKLDEDLDEDLDKDLDEEEEEKPTRTRIKRKPVEEEPEDDYENNYEDEEDEESLKKSKNQ